MLNAVSKFGGSSSKSSNSSTSGVRQTTEVKIRSDMINKTVCSLLAKLNIEATHYFDSELVSHALAFSQFDLVVKLCRGDERNCELVARKFLGLTGDTLDPNYPQLLARIRLDSLDHEIKLRLIDHLLRIEFTSSNLELDRNLLDSISRVLVQLILARCCQEQEQLQASNELDLRKSLKHFD